MTDATTTREKGDPVAWADEDDATGEVRRGVYGNPISDTVHRCWLPGSPPRPVWVGTGQFVPFTPGPAFPIDAWPNDA